MTQSQSLPTHIVCFDRDRTVDVHPPEHRDAVPLAWVKYLAHHDDTAHIDVWATGNQHLRAEAAIPGLRDAIEFWEHTHTGDVYEEFERPAVETYKPLRREGLRLVRTLYETQFPDHSFTFVVIDDEPMSDLEDLGWAYYAPWDFVDAVEAGTAPVTVPDDAGGLTGATLQSNAADITPDVETAIHRAVPLE